MNGSSFDDISAQMIRNGFTCRRCRFFAPDAMASGLGSCILECGCRTWSVDEWCSSWEPKESDKFLRENNTFLHDGRLQRKE